MLERQRKYFRNSVLLGLLVFSLAFIFAGFTFFTIGRDLTKTKQAEEEHKAREKHQQALVKMDQLAHRGGDIETLMNETVSMVANTLGVGYAKVLEIQPDGNSLLLKGGVGWMDGYVGDCLLDSGAESQAGYTILFNEPVIVNDMSEETRFIAPPLLTEHSVASGISTVIHGREKPFGVLGAHSVSKRVYTMDEVHFLESVGNLISEAIMRSVVEQDFKITNTILEAVNRSSELEEVFDIALNTVMELTDIDIVGIYIVDEGTNEAVLEAHSGYSETNVEPKYF